MDAPRPASCVAVCFSSPTMTYAARERDGQKVSDVLRRLASRRKDEEGGRTQSEVVLGLEREQPLLEHEHGLAPVEQVHVAQGLLALGARRRPAAAGARDAEHDAERAAAQDALAHAVARVRRPALARARRVLDDLEAVADEPEDGRGKERGDSASGCCREDAQDASRRRTSRPRRCSRRS